MGKQRVNYKVLFEKVFEILQKVARKDVPIVDLDKIIRDIKQEIE